MPRSSKFQFEGPIEGWVVNGMRAHYFRIENTHTREEYMQEAYLVFLRVRAKYERTVKEPKHFMALFKRAWSNELNDLANKATLARRMVAMPTMRTDDGDEVELDTVGELDNEGFLAIVVKEAPREVSAVLNLFLNAPQELIELALAGWTGNKDRRYQHGGSERLNKLLGLDPNMDVMQRVEDYLRVH